MTDNGKKKESKKEREREKKPKDNAGGKRRAMTGGVRKGGVGRWRYNRGDKEVRKGVKEQNI